MTFHSRASLTSTICTSTSCHRWLISRLASACALQYSRVVNWLCVVHRAMGASGDSAAHALHQLPTALFFLRTCELQLTTETK